MAREGPHVRERDGAWSSGMPPPTFCAFMGLHLESSVRVGMALPKGFTARMSCVP